MEQYKNQWPDEGFEFCPFCKCDKFLQGPTGGGSINFKCEKCRATFNDMGRLGVQLIGWPKISPMAIR